MNLRPAVIEIIAADIPASLAFYRLLGFDIPAAADQEPHVEASFGGVRLTFDDHATIHSFDPDWAPAAGGDRIGLAFECDSPGEVDAAWKEITSAGYTGHLEPWDAVWGMRYAVVHDPDGLRIDLFAQLPAT
jgi:catechol 2,3-dioxygenase-like lactoylglutathione lyase family enzyme